MTTQNDDIPNLSPSSASPGYVSSVELGKAPSAELGAGGVERAESVCPKCEYTFYREGKACNRCGFKPPKQLADSLSELEEALDAAIRKAIHVEDAAIDADNTTLSEFADAVYGRLTKLLEAVEGKLSEVRTREEIKRELADAGIDAKSVIRGVRESISAVGRVAAEGCEKPPSVEKKHNAKSELPAP